MGEVYLADDPALARKVALKVLPADLRKDPVARARLAREAKAAAALDSPFICKIYETGEADGHLFIAMEYVEGITLRELLLGGPMGMREALAAAREIAEALASAHLKGIIHRDLKPANILLTPQGHVKVLDFGLAKTVVCPAVASSDPTASIATAAPEDHLTTPGETPGTRTYMAPEQLRGEPPSAQSDIFSFGIVLQEMLTGVHPFLRTSTPGLIGAILDAAALPLALDGGHAPPLLQHTLKRMLAKEPTFRYHSVHEVRTNLIEILGEAGPLAAPTHRGHSRWWGTRATSVVAVAAALALAGAAIMALRHRPDARANASASLPAASIAVLPFSDLSLNRDQEYFCDGMAEEIISTLARIDGLRVTARTSAFAFKGRSEDVRQIGQQLNVAKLLEGSVRKAGNRLRITVQVVNTADGFHSWSRSYDRELTDVLAIQDEIAHEVAREFDVTVNRGGGLLASERQTADLEAYNLYLRGRYFWNKRTPEAVEAGLRLFEEAIQKDPGYALAYVGIADAHNLLHVYGGASPAHAHAEARAAIARALQIDDTLAEAHATNAILKARAWEWEAAEREYRRALELKPGDATIRCWFAQLLAARGRGPEAVAVVRRACDLDPLSAYANNIYGLILYLTRRNDEAKKQLAHVLTLDPNYHLAHENLGFMYATEGMAEPALVAARRAASTAGDADTSVVLGYACARAGRRDEARRILGALVERWRRGAGSAGRIAVIHAGLGDREEALDWLGKAQREHDVWVTQLRVDPIFDPLRADGRFNSLVRQVGLER
jgi:serine/threonine-protein kinase